jgi:hypothetical protein
MEPTEQEDFQPEWDTKAVVDAGVREGTMVQRGPVRKSVTDVIAQLQDDAPEQLGFQDSLARMSELQAQPLNGTGNGDKNRYIAARLVAAAGTPADDLYEALEQKNAEVENSYDVQGLVQSEITERARENVRATLDALSANLDPADENSQVAQLAIQELRDYLDEGGQPWGFESLTNQQIAGLAALQSQKDKNYSREKTYVDFSSALVDNHWMSKSRGRKFWDFAKSSVATSTATSLANYVEGFDPSFFGEVTNTLGEAFSTVASWKTTGKGYDAYAKSVDEFWSNDATARLLMFPQVDAEIQRVTEDNIWAYMSLIQPFVEKGAIQDLNVDYRFDQIGILSMVPGSSMWKLGKFAANVSQGRKPINVLIQAGAVDKASTLINKALSDAFPERARKITGMDKTEIAASAHPLDMTQIMPEQARGAAKEAAEALQKEILDKMGVIDQEFLKTLDPLASIQRSYYDETAKAARQIEVLGSYNDGINTARIVESTPTGFTVEVERGSKYSQTYDADTLKAANEVHQANIDNLHARADVIRGQIPGSVALRQAQAANIAVADRARMAGNDFRAKIKDKTKVKEDKRSLEEIADEEFGTDPEVVKIQDQIRSIKDQMKRNEKIIRDLEKAPKIETDRINYTFKESGTYDATTMGTRTLGFLSSPSHAVDKLFDQVGNATLAEFTETQNLGRMNNAVRETMRGLSPKQFKDVDHLLLHGDEMGIEMLPIGDLINGIDTKWGRIKLDSTHSISAYYARRRQAQLLHRIENQVVRRGLENGGFRQLAAKLKNTQGDPIKLYAKESAIQNLPNGIRRIYDHKQGTVVDIDDALRERLAKGEHQVVQFRSGHKFGDEIVNYGVVKWDKDMKPIDGQVLNYKPGYIPRQRPGVFYVAVREVPALIDGVKGTRNITERFFSTQDEASEWVARNNKEGNLRALPDNRYRDIDPDFDKDFDALNFGGMYTGERTDRAILMGLDGKEAHRASAYYSLQAYTNHVANRISINELKMNLVGRFQNTYGEFLKNKGDWRSELNAVARNDLKLSRAIEAQRTFIGDMMRMPDKFQNQWMNAMRSIAETMEPRNTDGLVKRGLKKIAPREWVMDFASRDPTEVLRAMAFHQFLGMYNPAQLLIQGLGFATAAAAYPGKALRILPKNLALRAAWYGRDNPEAVRTVADSVGMNGDELADILSEIKRSGLFDSLKTSADYNASIHGVSMAGDAVRRVLDSGLFFFREGEQWSRSYGYLLARDAFMKGKKASYKLTDKDIDKVVKDSMRFTLNLNRANRAGFQKGVLSVPTQFWQVSVKFIENLVGGFMGHGKRVWTTGEKAKILTGYLGLFGLAGTFGIGDWAVSAAINAYKDATNDKTAMTVDRLNIFHGLGMDEQTFARLIKGGIVQVLAHYLTGSDPELTSRVSIPAGVVETIDMYQAGDRTLTQALGGAFFASGERSLNAIKGLADIFGNGFGGPGLSAEEARQAVLEVAKGLGATTRNAEKAAWWNHLGYITDGAGRRIFGDMESEEFDSLVVWQALGFQPAKVGWMYDLKESVEDLKGSTKIELFEGRVDERTRLVKEMINRYSPDIRDTKGAIDELASEHKRAAMNYRWNLLIDDLTQGEKEQVFDAVKRHITNDNLKFVNILSDAIAQQAISEGRMTPGELANPLLIPSKE